MGFLDQGRVETVATAQDNAYSLHLHGYAVIVAMVSPYRVQREEFKQLVGYESIVEFYVHSRKRRKPARFYAKGYQRPLRRFVDIDTTNDPIETSMKTVLEHI